MRNFFNTAKDIIQIGSVAAASGAYVWYGVAHIDEKRKKHNNENLTAKNNGSTRVFDGKTAGNVECIDPKPDVDTPHP